MVRLMASWLFDHPVAWYNPRATSPAQLVTDSPVPGSRLADKPVFVLTSSRTFSGAEHFAYNLKTLKRATIVGETTSGASHAGHGLRRARPLFPSPNPSGKAPVFNPTYGSTPLTHCEPPKIWHSARSAKSEVRVHLPARSLREDAMKRYAFSEFWVYQSEV